MGGEYGVNYHEYMHWKNKEEIGDRSMPKSYQHALPDIDISGKVNKAVSGVTQTYDNNVKGIKKAQSDVKEKGKKFKNKLKMGMQIGLNKVKSTEDDDEKDEEV